jgi:uncharacterized protein
MLGGMSQLPSIELLEATHSFPGTYTIKAIGRSDSRFVARVVAAVREALKSEQDPHYTTRESGDAAHIAVTLEIHVERATQIHDAYNALLSIPDLVLLL